MNRNFEGVVPEAPKRPDDEMNKDGLSPQAEVFADDDAEIANSPKGIQATKDLEAGDISREDYKHIMDNLKKEYLR